MYVSVIWTIELKLPETFCNGDIWHKKMYVLCPCLNTPERWENFFFLACGWVLASSPGHSQFFNVHEKSGSAWHATAHEWRFTGNQHNYAWQRTPFLGLPAVMSSLIRVFQSLEEIFKRDYVRNLPAIISNALHLVVGMITCHRIPGGGLLMRLGESKFIIYH